MIVWQQGEDYVLMYSNFFLFPTNQGRTRYSLLLYFPLSVFALLHLYFPCIAGIGAGWTIVLVLAPLSWGKYRRRKSVRYFEKFVGFINVTF